MFSVRVHKLLKAPISFVNKKWGSKSAPVQPVTMAYASYESTETQGIDGPSPIVIMHGLLGSKANWNSLCKAFHKKTIPQRKIVAVDARNHGDSPHTPEHTYEHLSEDIRLLMDQLQMRSVVLLGHSMGGRAAMLFALRYPHLVDKMIVCDISPVRTSPNLRTMPKLFEAIKKIVLPNNVSMSSARLSADLQLSKSVNDKGLRSFLLSNLVQKFDGSYTWRINLSSLMANFENVAQFPDLDALKYFGPVLFVGGGASDFIQKTDHNQILQFFPKAKFHYVEGAGHWVHSEKPAEFLQICIDFLNTKKAEV